MLSKLINSFQQSNLILHYISYILSSLQSHAATELSHMLYMLCTQVIHCYMHITVKLMLVPYVEYFDHL